MSKPQRPSEIKQQAGLRLRAAREVLGITQEAMANVLGVTRTAYTNWENGVRLVDVAAAVRLYTLTGITLEWIFAGSLREISYDRAAQLSEKSGHLGAVVGGPMAEWPAAVARQGGTAGTRQAAAVPARRGARGGYLHERHDD